MKVKRILAFTVLFSLAVFCLPVSVSAANDLAIGNSVVSATENSTKKNTTKFVFGGEEWLLLSSQNNRLTLFLNEYYTDPSFITSANGQANGGIHFGSTTQYEGSNMQRVLNDLFLTRFSTAEQAAVLGRTLDQVDGPQPIDQKLWPLSKAEADGLANTNIRIAGSNHWWMRTANGGFIWFADAGGGYYAAFNGPADGRFGVRPALYLDLDSIVWVHEASEGRPDALSSSFNKVIAPTSNTYKVTVEDSSLSLTIDRCYRDKDGKLHVKYSAATTGNSNYLVAEFKNAAGDVYRADLARLDGAKDSLGEVTIQLPVGEAALEEIYFYNVSYQDANQTNYISAPVAMKVETLSSDASLAVLEVSGQLVELRADVYDYSVKVPNDVNTITLRAEASNDAAAVEGLGEKNISVGENIFKILVTAEDGTKQTYTLKVNRLALQPPEPPVTLGQNPVGGSVLAVSTLGMLLVFIYRKKQIRRGK